jgi:Glyoxalase-like domain
MPCLLVGRFWSAAIGRQLDSRALREPASIGFHGHRNRAGWEAVDRDAGPTWLFTHVPESKTVKNRLHLDFIAADPEAEGAQRIG